MRKLACFISFLLCLAISPHALADQVTFKGSCTGENGDPLDLSANLVRPDGDGPFPAVMITHGFSGDDEFLDPWEERLVGWGYVVLRLDSLSPRLRRTFWAPDHLKTAKLRAQDAYDAKSYLAQLPFVDKENIALIGWSHGGTAVLYAVDDIVPIQNRGNPFNAAVAFYPYCTEPLGVQNAPLLVFVGGKDQICRASNCRNALDPEKAPKELILKEYEDAHHSFDLEVLMIWYGHILKHHPQAAADAISRTQEFLEKYFK